MEKITLENDEQCSELLMCRTVDQHYGLCVRNICRVLPLFEVHPIASRLDFVVGMAVYEGRDMLVIDLMERLGKRRTQFYAMDASVVILATESVYVGLVVDEMADIFSVQSAQWYSRSDKTDQNYFFMGSLEYEGKALPVLDKAALLAFEPESILATARSSGLDH